jgi:hypothetical protein
MNLKTMTVDGISCQLADVSADVVTRALNDRDTKIADLTKQIADAKADKEKSDKDKDEQQKKDAATIATKDAEIATLKTQLASATVTPQMLDQMVKDRAEVAGKARSIIGDKLVVDGQTVEQIMAQVVNAKLGDAAKGWDANQIKASFNTLTAGIKATDAVAQAASVFAQPNFQFATPTNDGQTVKDQAYGDMLKELTTGWQQNPHKAN